ncbi:winged helix-turn-helix transcriptional regulator [Aquimarina longa]|uniref:winged helix-turn-helix transcriptional regulator n=1 Tax=Aquimarina longa TaxID=1080221 RepID=UPI001F07AB2F|nr:winged helix-turn-helix transcriptional regulator [Aquimarina longa]
MSRKLKALEKQKIITKNNIPNTVPMGVCYVLTSKGKNLIPIFNSMCEWGKSYTTDSDT